MGRRAVGNIKRQRGKFLAFLRGEYLGSHATEDQAQEAIDAALALDAGKVPDLTSIFGENYMREREEDGDVRGFKREMSVWRNHVATAKWYQWQLKKVRTPDIDQWLKDLSRKRKVKITRSVEEVRDADGNVSHGIRELSDETLGEQVVKHARRLAHGMFEAAVAATKIPSNPVANSKMPKVYKNRAEEEEDEWSFLFVEEIEALFVAIEAIVPNDTSKLRPKTLARLEQRRAFYRAVYAIAIYGGLRQGEIFGLHWEDVHFEKRGRGDKENTIMVRRTRNMGQAPKSESSKRPVPMLAPLRYALDQWRRHGGIVKTHGKVFPADGSAGQGNTPKVLGGYFGQSYDAAWEVRFRALATDREYVTFHDLRHTCASHLVMGTWGVALTELQVMLWLGHADLKTTKRYMHLAPGHLNELVAKMDAAAELSDVARRMELARQANNARSVKGK